MLAENKVAFVFPGQGAQTTTGIDQLSVQIEVVTRSCDLLNYAKNNNPNFSSLSPDYVAGHSVGMWSAVYSAEMINYASLLQVVERRARLMQEVGPGKMAAIVGKGDLISSELTSMRGVDLAAINCPGQFVISGREKDIVNAERFVREKGGRVLPINAAGPNHSAYMIQIQPEFRKYLQEVDLKSPIIPVMLDYRGTPCLETETIRNALSLHLSRPVLWEFNVEQMIFLGVSTFIEWGGNTLSKFINRIDPKVRAISITTNEAAEALSI